MNRSSLMIALLFILSPSAAVDAQRSDEVATLAEISKADFFVEGLAPVRKSGSYDVTIVYFMDYQCPSCRQYTPDVARVLKEDRRIRVIYRDTPLLGPRSDEAARAAIASHFQGRHEPFHHALMLTKGPLDESALRAAARNAGVDWPRLQRDLASRGDEIDMLITRNLELAAATGIQGTPAFIVGESQTNGALDYKLLKAEIADARKATANDNPGGSPEVEEPNEPGQAELEAPEAKRAKVQADGSSSGAIFKPAAQKAQEQIAGPDSVSSYGGYWAWIAALLALGGLVAVWRWANVRSERRSGDNGTR